MYFTILELVLFKFLMSKERGKRIFRANCDSCHHTIPWQGHSIGPNLAGIVGRKAGSLDGYGYSKASRASGVTWTADYLDKYLINPKKFMPG